MGMFEKDKVFGGKRLSGEGGEFNNGDEFILWDGEIVAKDVETEIGDATKTKLTVSRLDSPTDKFDVGTFATAIASKIEAKEDGDLPAVVELMQVPTDKGNDATVIQFVRAWNPSAPAATKADGGKAPAPSK